MPPIGYALRESYAGTVTTSDEDGQPVESPLYLGGLIVAGDREVNIVEALVAGDGVIVVEETDAAAIAALDARPELKRARVPEGATPQIGYLDRRADDLRHLANLRDIAGASGARKADLVDALEAYDRAFADGVAAPEDGWSVTNLLLLDTPTPED